MNPKKSDTNPKKPILSDCIMKTESILILTHKQCIDCLKVLSSVSNLNKHIKRCKIKKEKDNMKEELYQELLKKMEYETKKKNDLLKTQEMKINKLEKQLQSSQPNIKIKQTNNIQNQIINNQQINIIPFGEEDLSFITEKIIKRFLNLGVHSIPKLVDYIHFSNERPNMCNIYISNLKDPYVMIYDGNKWNTQLKTNVIHKLLEDKGDILEDGFDEFIESLDERTKFRFNRFLRNKEKDETLNAIKEEIKLILYNNKHVPLNIIKTTSDELLLNYS
jgi:hypothetical protein